jgi:hypothetical protein
VDTSLFAFATDLHDEGLEAVLDNVQYRAGLGGVSVAAAYHDGRDIFPHSPVRKVRFLEGGAVFFRPQHARWRDVRIRPLVSKLAHEADIVAELCAAAERRGLAVHAWTVFLHNGALGEAYPDCAPENAFGDPYVTELCPANPDVRAYVRALAADIARLGVATILAESLHYHPLEHGYAHERYFVALGPRARYLLALCFCPHCLEAARRLDADAGAVRRLAREELELILALGKEEPLDDVDREELGSLAGGHMGRYLEAREETVTSLAAEAAQAAASEGEARFTFMDFSGAVKGYASGRPSGAAAPSIAWKLGVDLAGVARACDGLEAIGYAADPERLRFDLEGYGALVPEERSLSVALRPMPPDCDSAENLRTKVRLARELGLTRVDFYHYGFLRLEALDWVQEAVREA